MLREMMSLRAPFQTVLRAFDSPILHRELRTLLRSRRSFFWLALYLVVLIIAFTKAWTTVEAINRDVAARTLFLTIVTTQSVLFYLLAPILTAGSLAGEHEQRTYDLLATTPLSGYHVVLAKCFSALCYVLLLIVASLPILAITFLLGGVGWVEMVVAAVSMVVGVLVNGMVGVACSAWVRHTYLALMLALMVVGAKSFMCPCAGGILSIPLFMIAGPRGGGGGATYMNLVLLGATIVQSGAQIVVFFGLTLLARNGYLAGSRVAHVRPKRVIRNPVVIKERRRRYPYYLIDPLAAPTPIPDGANAIYVKDKRHQPLGRLDFVIRISYVCLFLSLCLGLWFMTQDYYTGVGSQGYFSVLVGASHVVVAIILIAAPLFASTAFTSEKEHGTFTSLMTTLITPSAILWAKMKIILRYSLFLVVTLFIPAFIVHLSARGRAAPFLLNLLLMFPFYVLVIVASGLLGLLVSALSRRNMVSMAVTYLVVAACCFGPWLIETLGGAGGRPRSSAYYASSPLRVIGGMAHDMALDIVGPMLSPFRFLAGSRDAYLSAKSCYDHPGRILLYLGFWAVVTVAMFVWTLRALQRSLTGEQKKQF
jgi:ABC-type transport system involved in multi-copper enzyme maturation permease subunit